MRHLILTIVAIGIAGVAAIAATTALLNTPMRIGPAAGSTPTAASGRGSRAHERSRCAAAKGHECAAGRRTCVHEAGLPKGSRLPRKPFPKARTPMNPTRIPTRASRLKTCRPICNTTRMPA